MSIKETGHESEERTSMESKKEKTSRKKGMADIIMLLKALVN